MIDRRNPIEIRNGGQEEVSAEPLALEGIAIIGMSGRFPGAPDIATFWANVLAGKDSISHFSGADLEARDLSVLESSPNYVAARGVLADADKFDADFFGIPPREAEKMDPQHRIFLETCWSALEDAGYDSTSYAGQIGLFGGCSLNTYLLANLCHDRVFIDQLTGNYQVGDFQSFMGNDKDFLTSRVAYKLNLRGPCITVSGACATSLVAISQACQNLLNYQCDMALAGGVSVTLPQRRGHLYTEGGIGSSDGVCRPFDALATGTVFSHGAGVVVLKRLEDAVADRDHITAVIRGFAVNNDGSMKAGYMAPSVQGQADVVAAAQAMAGIDAISVGYVEAHGTATPLGDPIEVAALTKAFRLSTDESGFCAIGTAKANVGHLDAAAGVTGVIKAALSLSNAVLPPLVHFESPNTNIDFEHSPFYVNRELKPWVASGPRRAGVSAFGVGGVNAHAVMEQAPAMEESEPSTRTSQVLCLSARSEASLQASIENLAKWLEKNPEARLDDVAYTLAVGRKAFDHRAAFVCSKVSDAAAKLGVADSTRQLRAAEERGVSFLFPGQGSQFPGMGASLYTQEPFYRRLVDECAEILRPHLGYDLREALYPATPTSPEAAVAMQQTELAQVAIFVTELSLARLWQSWGIQPQAMVGHSVGEYVAAALAGVMSREHALRLVALRGRMMQEMPRGGMVSVRLSEAELQIYLEGEISLAALNTQKLSVLAGPLQALERLEVRLTEDKVGFVRLRTSHAFHSPMMDPMLEAFEAEVNKVSLSAPSMAYVSSVTGTWIRPEEAISSRFWAEQVRKPVRFADALATLITSPKIFLEVGPGATLTTLAKQQAKSKSCTTIASLPQRDEHSPIEGESLQHALKELWLAGFTPNWNQVYGEEKRRRVALPTYAFDRKRYWIDPPALTVPNPTVPGVAQDALLQTAGGKDLYAAEHLKDVEMPERKLRLQPIIAEVFAELSGIETEPEEMEQQFLELGFDSLLLTQATQSLQRKFGVKLTLRQIMEQYPSISSLAVYLDSVLPADAYAAETKPVLSPTIAMSIAASSEQRNDPSGSSAMERLLNEQLATMTKLFEQQIATLKAATGVSASSPASTVTTTKVPVTTEPVEVKHGSYRPPQVRVRQEVDEKQQGYISTLISKYERHTPGSKRLTQQGRVHLADPRAVAGFRPQWKEMVYPLITERAKGSKIWDIDGNEYVDIVNGYGAIMFGHSPQFVVDAVREQIELGVAIGPQSPLAGEVAALICELTGNERVTFCNTGSEAVMAAIRVARTVTGRDKLVYFAGDYHGTFDEVLMRRTARGTVAIAPGIPAENTGNVVVLEYGSEQSLEYITTHADEIAAVLIEPVQTRNPALQPIEFIRTVREITERAGIAFILDEVVTGFRAALGGTQEMFGIRADMVTYGKVIGGGYPIGVLSGKASFMDALDGGGWQYGDDSVPETGVTFFAGTFVRHPLALAAARSVLRHLKAAGPQLQLELNRKTAEFAESLDKFFVERGVPSRIHHFASWFYFTFHNDARLGGLLYYAMREKGVHIQEGYPCFLTTSHTQADLDKVQGAFRETIEEMQAANILEALPAPALVPSPPPQMHPDALPGIPVEVPITAGQREIYFAAALNDDANCAFNESLTLRLHGAVDTERLLQAVRTVLNRHDALRSTISEDGETLKIAVAFAGTVEYFDLSQSATGTKNEAAEQVLQRKILEEGRTPFSLTRGPLARASVLKIKNDEVVLLFTAHHMVLDGASANQILEEIAAIYNTGNVNDSKLQPLLPFSSYAMKEQARLLRGEFAENESYWVKQFTGLTPVLDLPTDRPRPKQKSYRGSTLKGSLGPELYSDLKKVSAKQGCTLFVTLLSGFQLLLHRLTRQTEVVVGISAAGQSLIPNASLVGHCVHFLPMLSQLHDGATAKDHLGVTRSQLFDAFDHQEFTYGSLLQKLTLPRDSGRLPLIEVQFNLEKVGAQVDFNDLSTSISSNPKQFVNTDLFLNVIETKTDLEFDLGFNTDLFDEKTVCSWMRMYATLLADVARDPSRRVDELALLDEVERMQIVHNWNRTKTDWGDFVPVHRTIERRAQENLNRVAIECGEVTWSAEELERYANRVARKLLRQGLQPGDLVGICITRSAEMVGALLGVLKAGGVYIPLDPSHPRERLEMILEDAAAAWLVIGTTSPTLTTAAKVVMLNCKLDEDATRVDRLTSANDLAYVIYTSGSTGRPKGVTVEHGALMNLLRSMEREPGLGLQDVFVAVTTLAFDIAGLELLLPLMTGARLVIATDEQAGDGFQLLDLLESSHATVLQATPGAWRMLIEAGWDRDLPLKALCGGEALPRDLADQLLERSGQVWNMYGPTETTIWSSATRVTAGTGPLLLGTPIANTQFYLLDERLHPVPVGVVGELYIGGAGLARGYWKRPELTAERFMPNPFMADRIYRTGDLGRWRVDASGDGSIELLGRTDFQVKVRGYRIELGEIEAVLIRHPLVREAVVLAHSGDKGTTRLIGFVEAGGPGEPPPGLVEELQAMLSVSLPDYMVPAAILPLPQFPRNPNGKLDRKALPDAGVLFQNGFHSSERKFVAASTPEQKKLAVIWAEVLLIDRVSVTDSIFELGGDSLLIFRIAARCHREGLNVTAAQIFQHRTILALANALVESQEPTSPRSKAPARITAVPRSSYRSKNIVHG